MIKVSRATEENIREAATFAREVYKGDGDLIKGAMVTLKHGIMYSISDDTGRIGCIVGGILLTDGVAQCSGIITNRINAHPVGYTRTVLNLVERNARLLNLHRMEITVKSDFSIGQKWAEALGFEKEGLLRCYGADKSDYFMYGRVF